MITITKGITETTVNGLHELYVCPKSVNLFRRRYTAAYISTSVSSAQVTYSSHIVSKIELKTSLSVP